MVYRTRIGPDAHQLRQPYQSDSPVGIRFPHSHTPSRPTPLESDTIMTLHNRLPSRQDHVTGDPNSNTHQ